MEIFLIYTLVVVFTICLFLVYTKEEDFKEYFGNTIIDYKEFDLRNKQKPLKKVIFKTAKWDLEELPIDIKRCLVKNSKRSKGYTTVYFSDKDVKTFIEKYYPEYFKEYMSLVPGAYKADLFRLLVLYKYGGVYSDISQLLLCDLETFLNLLVNNNNSSEEDIVIVRDLNGEGIFNSFMAFKQKENSLLKKMIDHIVSNIRRKDYGENCLDVTGPKALLKAYNNFMFKDSTPRLNSGTFSQENMKLKVKILSHTVYDNDSENKGFIEYQGRKVILARFPQYYKIMYNNRNIKRYGELWKTNKIFV